MTLTIPIPENLDAAAMQRLDRDVREFVGVRLYRDGRMSHGKLAKFLGVERGQIDEILARHGVVDEFSAEEIAAQVETSRQLQHFNRYVYSL